jgi:uncharacterized protein (DUF169 family)
MKNQKYLLEDYQALGRSIKEKLELESEIVAVKYIKSESEIPDDFIRPLRDTGHPMTLCIAMTAARRDKKKIAMTAMDNACTPVTFAKGWAKVSIIPFIKSQVKNDWNKNTLAVLRRFLSYRQLGLGVSKAMWPLNKIFMRHRGMLTAPLSETPFIPETVVIYGTPKQMQFIENAFSYESKYVPIASNTGYGGACFSAAYLPLAVKKPIFANLGLGDRAFARPKDDEVVIGMLAHMAFDIDKYLFKPGEKNNGTTVRALFAQSFEIVDEDTLPGWRDIRNIMKYYE